MIRQKLSNILHQVRSSAANTWITRLPSIRPLYEFVARLVTPERAVFVEYETFEMLIDPSQEQGIFRGEVPEKAVQTEIHRHLSPGDTAYDIGGYHGAHSLSMRRAVGESGRVVIYEADPENSEFIERTIDQNGFDNVHVVNAAVSDSEETLTLKKRNPSSSSAGTTIRPPEPDDYMEIDEIGAVRLSDEIADKDHIDLIKIDIEGAEYEVIRDIASDLDVVDTLLIELHHANLGAEKVKSICQILSSKGSIYDIESGDSLTVSEIVNSPDRKHIRWECDQDVSL